MAGFASTCSPPGERARRAGTRPRTDHTIETALAIIRDLALFLADRRGKQDWALTDVHDIEAFLATLPKAPQAAADRAAAVLPLRPQPARSSWPTPPADLTAAAPRGFTGQTIALDQQRDLFRRWTTSPDAHPHEALLGILALLHGASSSEVRHLHVSDVDAGGRNGPARQAPAPGAAGPGQLAGAAALPGPPRAASAPPTRT